MWITSSLSPLGPTAGYRFECQLPQKAVMSASYSGLPNELICNIAENLSVSGLNALIRTDRHSAVVLLPLFLERACMAEHAVQSLAHAIKIKNTRMVKLLLHHGTMDAVSRYIYLRESELRCINRRPSHTNSPADELSLLRGCLFLTMGDTKRELGG